MSHAPKWFLALARFVAAVAFATACGDAAGPEQPGPATAASIAGGDGQSGSLGTALHDSLVVLVTDARGNPVPSQLVRWSVAAGGGGASAYASWSRADGKALVVWYLGTRLDTTHVLRATIDTVATLQFTATPLLPSSALVVKSRGDTQLDTVAQQLQDSVVVEVRLADGRLVSGALVTFAPAAGSGSVSPTSARTGVDGRAASAWTLGTTAGSQSLQAAAAGLGPVTFTAGAAPDVPESLTVHSGNGQVGDLGAALPLPVAARLVDRYSNGIPSRFIRWLVRAGGGAPADLTTLTDSTGVARVTWTLGARLDTTHVLAAQYAVLFVTTFSASPRLPTTASLSIVSGDNQVDTVGHVLRDSLVVRLALSGGRQVEGAWVRWSVASAGSISPDSSKTDREGRAEARWTLGPVVGLQVATAAVGSLPAVTFGAQAVTTPPAPTHAAQRPTPLVRSREGVTP